VVQEVEHLLASVQTLVLQKQETNNNNKKIPAQSMIQMTFFGFLFFGSGA
jgi:hypothetical protein